MDPNFISPWKPGDRIGSFTVLHHAGRGHYGEILIVQDCLEQRFALKILFNTGGDAERELKGILRKGKVLVSPSLVTLHHIDRLPDGRYYYTMDAADNLLSEDQGYLPDTLENRILRNGSMTADEVLALAYSLLQGLKILHDNGLSHRDVKPGNIIFRNGMPMLSDFGLISELDGTGTSIAGTPGFLPPEALSVKPDPAGWDLYALGKVMYCIWTGLDSADYPRFPDNKTLNPAEYRKIRSVYAKACDDSPSNRFRSADEFLNAIQKAQAGKIPFQKPSKKLVTVFSALLCIVLFLVAAGGFFYCFRGTGTRTPKFTEQELARYRKQSEEKARRRQEQWQKKLEKEREELERLRREPVFLTDEDRKVFHHVKYHYSTKELQEYYALGNKYTLKQEIADPEASEAQKAAAEAKLKRFHEIEAKYKDTPIDILRSLDAHLTTASNPEEYVRYREQARKALDEYKRTHADWQDCHSCQHPL